MFNSTFLLLTGLITFLVCLILSAILASHFTKPLIEMGEVAKAMTRLDFSKKYEGRRVDEIRAARRLAQPALRPPRGGHPRAANLQRTAGAGDP